MSGAPLEGLAGLAALPPSAPPPLSRALEAELGALTPVAPRRPRRQLVILAALSLFYGAVVVAVTTVRRDAGELPVAWLVGGALGWLVGFVVPCYLALVPRPGSMMPRWQLAAIAAVGTALAFVVLGFTVHPTGPSSVAYGTEQFLRGHTCLELGLASALVPVSLGAIFLRGALPAGARGIAAALGAGAGSLGGLVLHLHCHVTDALHLGVIHGGVVIASALLAAALVPRAIDLS